MERHGFDPASGVAVLSIAVGFGGVAGIGLEKTAIPQRKPFYFGMALHGLSVLLAVGSVELMTYLAKDCTGCYSGIQLIILVPLLWLLFIVGAVLNVVGLRTPRAGHTTKLRKR